MPSRSAYAESVDEVQVDDLQRGVIAVVEDSDKALGTSNRKFRGLAICLLCTTLVVSAGVGGVFAGRALSLDKQEECASTDATQCYAQIGNITYDHQFDPLVDTFAFNVESGTVYKGVVEPPTACHKAYYDMLPTSTAMANFSGAGRRQLSWNLWAGWLGGRSACIGGASSQIRNDQCGGGCFGDGRGSRTHAGVDILIGRGANVNAPFDIEVMRVRNAGSAPRDAGVLVCGAPGSDFETHCAQIFYVVPVSGSYRNGQRFSSGTVMGVTTDIDLDARYASCGMQNHVHFELYRREPNRCHPDRRTLSGCRWIDFVWGSDTSGAWVQTIDPAPLFCGTAVAAACS